MSEEKQELYKIFEKVLSIQHGLEYDTISTNAQRRDASTQLKDVLNHLSALYQDRIDDYKKGVIIR